MQKKTTKSSRFWRRLFPRKKYRDFLFQRVFQDKNDLLELYNALNGTHYTNPNDLEITTLEDALFLSMKNDLSFIIASSLNLYEHQSTVNPNMPIRGFFYFSKLYETYITFHNLDIYGRKQIHLPTPQYIIFYNGREPQPEEQILRLSSSFIPEQEYLEPILECTAHVININYGHNEKLMKACKKLSDYSCFIHQVYQNQDDGLSLKEAIADAMDYCIRNDILKEILQKYQGEVFDMILTRYDKKLHEKTLREEGFEDGFEEGFEDGFDNGFDNGFDDAILTSIIRLMSFHNCSAEKAMDMLGIPNEKRPVYLNMLETK